MKIGLTIKQLRKSKNIRASATYHNLLTRPAIAKFEKGESDTTAEKLMVILDRLNISLEEFEMVYRIEDNGIYAPDAYIKAFYTKNIEQLRYLSEMSLQKFYETGINKYQHNSAVINLLIRYINGNFEDFKEDLKLLQKYLSECEYWSYYEITLFTNTLSFYSNDFIDITYNHAKQTLVSYQKLVRYKNEMALLLFNILQFKISGNYYLKLSYYFEELNRLQNECVDNMYIQTIIRFYSLLIQIIKNPQQQNKLEPELYKIINIFEYLGMGYKAEQCKKLVNQLKS